MLCMEKTFCTYLHDCDTTQLTSQSSSWTLAPITEITDPPYQVNPCSEYYLCSCLLRNNLTFTSAWNDNISGIRIWMGWIRSWYQNILSRPRGTAHWSDPPDKTLPGGTWGCGFKIYQRATTPKFEETSSIRAIRRSCIHGPNRELQEATHALHNHLCRQQGDSRRGRHGEWVSLSEPLKYSE